MSEIPEQPSKDAVPALLAEVRGEVQSFDREDWKRWFDLLSDWTEAYPAFGSGRLLRAKASREARMLKSSEHLAQAAVFASVPGRLFDLLFRAGIESEIAAFARAVEALEPGVESEMRMRWHPDGLDSVHSAEAELSEDVETVTLAWKPEPEAEPSVDPSDPERPKLNIPEKGSLAREVVLGAIERSIEQEIEEVRQAQRMEASRSKASDEVPAEPPALSETLPSAPAIPESLSPLARWALTRSQETGFSESGAVAPSVRMGVAAKKMEDVLSSAQPEKGESPQGGLEQQAALIDLFIRNEPMIGPVEPDIERPAVKELAKESLVEDTSLITETMARIYASQGQLGRARRAYKLLSLKYPEKSVYFAAQSKKLGRKASED